MTNTTSLPTRTRRVKLFLALATSVASLAALSGLTCIDAPSSSATVVPGTTAAITLASRTMSWPMFANSTYSDCTVAAVGDLIRAWNIELGRPADTLSTKEALAVFASMGGTNSQGVPIDALMGIWQTPGLYGNAIIDAEPLDYASIAVTKRAITLLGGVLAEVYLTPQTQLELTNGETVTDTTPGSPSLAHALTFIGYNDQYLTAITFGHIVHVSWAWWLANGVLEYGVIPNVFQVLGHGPTPGISTNTLVSWLTLNADV